MLKRKKIKQKLNQEFGLFPEQYSDIEEIRDRLDDIKVYYEELYCESEDDVIDDTTWNELQMDEIFLLLNHTRSYMGEQVLYNNLKCMKDEIDEDIINCFMNDKDTREEIEYRLNKIGKHSNDYGLPVILSQPELWKLKHGFVYRLLQLLFVFTLVLGIILHNKLFILFALVCGIVNINIYAFTRFKYEGLLDSLGSVKQIILTVDYISDMRQFRNKKNAIEVRKAVRNLRALTRVISDFQIRRSSTMIANFEGILLDYLGGVFLYDIVEFNAIIKMLSKKKEDMMSIFIFLGTLDMEVAVASYRNNVSKWSKAYYDMGAGEITMLGMVHPLIDDGVCNDVSICNKMVLTGSNASGKSTFMKAIAINCIMGKVIHTVTAQKFIFPYDIKIMSCMTMSDDIVRGKSYFINELERVKVMMDEAEKNKPILLLFDELLRGTDYEERISIAEAVLNELKYTKAFVIIATHDVKLVELIKNDYDSYYFDSKVVNNMITFDYKLHIGVVKNRNAVALLDAAGFAPAVIKRAWNNVRGLKNEDK